MPLLRRKKTSTADITPSDSTAAGKPTGKGRPTPKRQRSAPPPPPPMTRKEAYARQRQKAREGRADTRAGASSGDERYVLARDRGPVRRLVRDIVDARRNAGSYAFAVAMLIVVLSYTPALPPVVKLAASYLTLGLILVVGTDGFVLSRIIKRAIRDRFPDETGPTFGHSMYGNTRAITFRRLRQPKPQVKIGQPV